MEAPDGLTAAAWFEKTFGRPAPLPLGDCRVKTPGVAHWATHDAPGLAPARLVVPAFPDTPETFTVVGHWGFGMGSQAFYFVERAPNRRVFLRLAYGGAFGEPSAQAEEIVAALAAYDALTRSGDVELVSSDVVVSLGNGDATLVVQAPEGYRETLTCDLWAARAGKGTGPAPKASEFLAYLSDRARRV